jgi:hypothetical protein
MIELIQQLGFLPLLVSGISGYSAEEMAQTDKQTIEISMTKRQYNGEVRRTDT